MAARSDAATDRVTLGSAPSTAALTIAGWARIDTAGAGSFNPIIRLSVNSGDASSWILGFKGANGRTPSVYSPTNTSGISAPEQALGTWVYVAATLSAGSAQLLYGTVPGVLSKVTGAVAASGTADRLCFFGRSAADGSEWLAGALAYQRIWTAVLSDAELAAESQSATVVQTANLWAHWWPDATAGLTDASGNGRNLTAGSTALDADPGPVLDTGPAPVIRTSGFQGPGPFGHQNPWAGTTRQSTTPTTQTGDATLTGSGTLTAASDTTKPAAAAVTATGAVTAAASVAPGGDALLAASGSTTAAASTDKPATAALAGAGALTAATDSTKPVTASLAGAGSLTTTAATTKPVDAALAGTVATTAAATASKTAASSLTGVATITADASIGAAPVVAAAALTGVGALAAAAAKAQTPSVSLAGAATFTAIAAVSKQIDAALTATGLVAAATTKTLTASAVLTASGQLTATAAVPQAVSRGQMSPADRQAPAMGTTPRASQAMTPTTRGTSTMGGQ